MYVHHNREIEKTNGKLKGDLEGEGSGGASSAEAEVGPSQEMQSHISKEPLSPFSASGIKAPSLPPP